MEHFAARVFVALIVWALLVGLAAAAGLLSS
jgi:hypothetical protein